MSQSTDWRADLRRNTKGVAYPNHRNVVFILQHDPMFAPERLWYDEFLNRVVMANSPTRYWRDDDDTKTAVDIQDRFGLDTVNQHVVASAVQLVARQRTRHCVREWLESLTWDGIPRIAMAFCDYWGAAQDEYTLSASQNFFVGMVARILKPGCKLDTMPVFEGAQGIKKSSALAVLGGEWYATAHESVSSKDFLQGLPGHWLIEIAELQSFTRAEVNAVKTMMSVQVDVYRPSYGRHVLHVPRQGVFCGTTNADDWGTDDTGLRRFWPIRCGDIDLDMLAKARTQLFAEAVVAFCDGTTWWDMPSTTAGIQADRQWHDEWTVTVLEWCKIQPTEAGVTIRQVLTDALKVPLDRIGKSEQMRVASVLRKSGWIRKQVRNGEEVAKVWVRKDS